MTNVRDSVLSKCYRKKIEVKVFTTNGFQLKGVIIAYDDTVVVLQQKEGEQAMVNMTALSTIMPAIPVLTNQES